VALLGRFASAEEALAAIVADGIYRVEREGPAWVVYNAPEEPLGWPIGEDASEEQN
jgi:hypothetical protein